MAELDEARAVRARIRCLHTGAEVEAAIGAMAQAIAPEVRELDPVVVAVMQGGAFAAVELCKHFEFAYRYDYVHVTRYGNALEGGALEWRVRPAPGLAGNTVLLVDDVLDRGATLAAVQQALHRIGVARLYTAVLVIKDVMRTAAAQVDFAAFRVGDHYLVGSGLDYKGYWRGLPGLYALESP